MAEPPTPLIVFAPDFFAVAFTDPAGLQILGLWRNDRIRPVVNRSLLLRYFRLFRALGMSDTLVRRWAWWLASSQKTRFLSGDTESSQSPTDLCRQLAQESGAEFILHSGRLHLPPGPNLLPSPGAQWLPPAELIQKMEALKPRNCP